MNKSLFIPLVLLVILVVIFIWSWQSEKSELAPSEIDNFLAIDSGTVDKIEIKKLGSQLEFDKHPDGWYVRDGDKSYKTAAGMVDDITRISYGLQVGEVVSRNPDKQMLFQVDTLTGSRVDFYRGDNPLGGVFIGKAGPSYQESYVRKPGSDDVYLAQGSFAYLFNRPPSSFRDKTLLSLTPTEINAIEFVGRGTDYSLLQQDSLWKVLPHKGESFMGDPAKIGRLVSQLSNLHFSDFVTDPESLTVDFNKPQFEVTIGLKDGTDRTLSMVAGEGESKDWYVRSSTSDEPYIIRDYLVNNIAKKPDDLRPGESKLP